jgi:small conductance mechanosensitive channel
MNEFEAAVAKFIEDFLSFTWLFPILKAIGSILLVVVICYVIYRVILLMLTRYITHAKGDKNIKRAKTIINLTRSFMRYLFVIIAIIFSLQFVGLDPATIFAGAGVVGIVIGFAFQDLLKDIVAGFFILVERSYNVGDLVEINGLGGTIVNIGIKTTTFSAYTGELIILNNRDVSRIVNFTNAEYSVCVNQFTLPANYDINQFTAVFNSKIPELREKYPEIIQDPRIVGVTGFDLRGYFVEIHTKVKPLTQYQFKRSLFQEVLTMFQENSIDPALRVVSETIKKSEVK